MSRTFHLEIVTPTAFHDLGEVDYLRAPGTDGLFGVEGGHAPALISLGVGALKITAEGKTTYWATSGGYAEITGSKVQLLLETVERSDKVDKERAKKSLERAKQRLQENNLDQTRARASMQRALNRINTAGQ